MTRNRLLRWPVPLTGAAAFGAEQSWATADWQATFLGALEHEARDSLDLLYTMERTWFGARRRLDGRRKTSHAAAAVDVLAAAPMLSATSLAGILGIAVKNALGILDELEDAEIAIEVTHRSKLRLFGLTGLAPLREVVRTPYRPEPGRGPGRPRVDRGDDPPAVDVGPLPPLTPIERHAFDYTALEEAMAHLDAVVRRTRHRLGVRSAADPPMEAPLADGSATEGAS